MRIMLVDDNKECCDAMESLFRHMGHEVSVAYDANQAIAIFEKTVPEVILMDIGLPGMNGWDATEKIRHDRTTEKIRVLAYRKWEEAGRPLGDGVNFWLEAERLPIICALTAFGQKADFARSAQVGMDEHFVKPLQVKTLREFLAQRSIKL